MSVRAKPRKVPRPGQIMFGERGVSSYKVAEHPRLTPTLPPRLRLRGRDKLKEEIKGCGIQFDSALATTFNFLKRNEFSGITGGLSMRARAPKRPTIGLPQIGSAARDRDSGRKQGRGKSAN